MVSSSDERLRKAKAATPGVYQRQAAGFASERDASLRGERGALDRFAAGLSLRLPGRGNAGGRVLDLGCGTGRPVAEHLLSRGLAVTGLDASPAMLALARALLPDGRWVEGEIRALDSCAALAGETFDGVLSWHGSFHLSPDEQRAALPAICDRVAPGGALMLTIGPEAGETTGIVGGETVYHASLDHAEYRRRLEGQGFATVEIFDAPGGAVVLLAMR